MNAVSVRAHAKINLDLRVLGTRPDGYHELRTVFQTIEVHDSLTCVAERGPFRIRCGMPGVPHDERNLVWRAAALLWRAFRRSGPLRDVTVRVDKRIPMQSGLGGGSADAAAALVALTRFWGLDPAPALLRDVAAAIGADVPFFLWGGTALGLGRGDEVYPLAELPRFWVVLLLPPFGVSTREAYGWYDEERGRGVRFAREPQFLPGPLPSRAAQLVNDLEGPIARHHPEIAQMKAALRQADALAAAMSGSGSAVYGLFRSRRTAVRALPLLARWGWRTLLTRTVSATEYVRSARPRRHAWSDRALARGRRHRID